LASLKQLIFLCVQQANALQRYLYSSMVYKIL
jgi:hypothetical protein